jgi:hypothetical protein
MSDPITLDARIRAKAAESLATEIDNLFKPVEKKFADHSSIETRLTNSNGRQIHAHACIDAAKVALIERLLPQRQDAAVREFMEKVEKLQNEVDELRDAAAEC